MKHAVPSLEEITVMVEEPPRELTREEKEYKQLLWMKYLFENYSDYEHLKEYYLSIKDDIQE